jgi:hypothetical protein
METVTLPEWARSAELLTARWLKACEDEFREFRMFGKNNLALSPRESVLLCVAFWMEVWERVSNERRKSIEDAKRRIEDDRHHSEYTTPGITAYHIERDWFSTEDKKRLFSLRQRQGQLLVSMVGPGWEFDVRWRTDSAVGLARYAYDTEDWSVMGILADALQDAGCEEKVLLEELRSPESQWLKGARILDELLGLR